MLKVRLIFRQIRYINIYALVLDARVCVCVFVCVLNLYVAVLPVKSSPLRGRCGMCGISLCFPKLSDLRSK